ncbi:glycerophosphodiester phosphodiesterase [Psychroserpens ponticola]|uniref:Glycerophosphodiester phosphodiesterase family protein n=1 Tax=Psychroserpens ponticola TaxID=2932268 RepID=A0ABY7RWM4_9FLAO|nr:glycerophosphodiester phosphodiesterase family protein [Psychroserpens ponticola]WCO01243.1 glycerophosphodiester phosphodiesterase family protein [Psychroserpens ponticola]
MSKKALKIGHRGAKNHVAENTLASIEKALEFKVDAIEIDVHKCASGELVVFHDFTLDRMTNGSGEVSKHTLKQLKNLKVNDQYEIPTLEDVLNIIDKKCMLNIELKGRDTAFTTCKIVSEYIKTKQWDLNHFLISSFQHQELEAVYNYNNQLRLGVLTKASVSDAIEFAKTINAFSIHPNVALVTKDNVSLAQNKGYKVLTWTVNDQPTIKRMKAYGVDGIISDNPDLI